MQAAVQGANPEIGALSARPPSGIYGYPPRQVLRARVSGSGLPHGAAARDLRQVTQGFAATLIARMSGDRACDINEEMRQQVIGKLKLSKAPSSWIDMVEHFKELDEKEESQMFGEALPPGLTLINNK